MKGAYSFNSIPALPITAAMCCMAAVIAPFNAYAATLIGDILKNTLDALNIIMQIMMTLAFVIFIWGIVKLIANAGNPQAIKQAKAIMLYGIIGLLIMASVTGIIALIQAYFGIPGGGSIKVPQF